LKERGFVRLARLSGEGDLGIIFKEIAPNVLPYIGMMFGGSMTGAMVSEVALELIGLGPSESNTLGLIIYWAMYYGATVRRMWWWIVPPIICLVALFLGLQLLNIGLDEVYNPRIRR
jgi:peptide/nickel transport system permease protein